MIGNDELGMIMKMSFDEWVNIMIEIDEKHVNDDWMIQIIMYKDDELINDDEWSAYMNEKVQTSNDDVSWKWINDEWKTWMMNDQTKKCSWWIRKWSKMLLKW